MGSGVSNQGVFQHRRKGAGVIGYRFRYHDDLVTGNAWPESVEIPPNEYSALRAGALQGAAPFLTALALSSWAPFFATWSGIDTDEARLSVLDLK